MYMSLIHYKTHIFILLEMKKISADMNIAKDYKNVKQFLPLKPFVIFY